MNRSNGDSASCKWARVKLRDILKQQVRKVSVEDKEIYQRIGVRWYADGPFVKDEVRGKAIKSQYVYRVRTGDFIYNRLFAWKGSFGVIPLEMDRAVASIEFPLFTVGEQEADAEFIWRRFSLPSVWRLVEDKSTGSTRTSRLRFKEEDFLDLAIDLPPLPEQRAIARVLRTVQQAKEATEKVIAATRQLKQSLMRHLFTYGPVPFDQADRVKLKETEIGPVPKHWELKRLGEVALIERGKFAHRPRNDPRFYGGSIPFIQTGDVTRSGGRITTYTQTLNELGLSVSRVFPKGTIVLTIAANIGDTAILEFDSAFPDSLVGITPKTRVVQSEFLLRFLQTQKAEMDRLAPRGTQKNINIRFLEPWSLVLPPPSEQYQVAAQLAVVATKLAAEETRRDALDTLFQSLLHHLMTGKVRVHNLKLPSMKKDAP